MVRYCYFLIEEPICHVRRAGRLLAVLAMTDELAQAGGLAFEFEFDRLAQAGAS